MRPLKCIYMDLHHTNVILSNWLIWFFWHCVVALCPRRRHCAVWLIDWLGSSGIVLLYEPRHRHYVVWLIDWFDSSGVLLLWTKVQMLCNLVNSLIWFIWHCVVVWTQAQTLADTKDSQIADLHQQLAMVNKQFEDEVGVTDSGHSKAGVYDSKNKIFVKHKPLTWKLSSVCCKNSDVNYMHVEIPWAKNNSDNNRYFC